MGPTNGHNGIASKTNGYSKPHVNGSSKSPVLNGVDGLKLKKRDTSIRQVALPGSTLYDDSHVDREEYIRLVIQSLRDVGYIESAATLEAESGYTMETPEVSEFRRCILEADWSNAHAALVRLGATEEDELWDAKFLISQQKYLELLEAGRTTTALQVLRRELARLSTDPDQLHALSSLIMCSNPEDLRQRANWDGASGNSRRQLLLSLQTESMNAFPQVTTAILEVHTDEVWNIAWSHSGNYLASVGRDKTAIIWRVEYDKDPSTRELSPQIILREHMFSVGCVAWSLDDSILLTASENIIKLWNSKTGVCKETLTQHTDVVAALTWLPDNSGFISGGLDRKIIFWDSNGRSVHTWTPCPVRVTDLAVMPDMTRLIVVGMYETSPTVPVGTTTPPEGGPPANAKPSSENRAIVYDLATKEPEMFIPLEGELSSVKVSGDSKYALINRAPASDSEPPSEIHLWDLETERLVKKYVGHKQSRHVIRSCFGGVDGAFIASGSEDGIIYVWHRDSGTLLEALTGHGAGSVNSVAWNPRNERMFASCSDDKTIRIWEAPPSTAAHPNSRIAEYALPELENGKGKGRERWDGYRAGSGSDVGASSIAL
ncbi:hypothetical protein POSPLADRAFT_1179030 [Postia placenta MAD-698-R-SB12]|uniref:CTLH domain-containing protein n=1 Tax=Postia placenta MAD-698-R-SB12 TaxID=670580 RepID=A0A1X6NA79_9APHY|nr:hypothetical protein POSPLADRAFT_1179030 [Postia placenta MAD-698-R-SB12]OSX65346.1 hypothetical protein POSPLADRAFT_1179030 [Postia placenta MAD-698-R-SB12]